MKSIIIKLVVVLIVVLGLGYGIFYLWQNSDKYFFKGESINTKKENLQKRKNLDDKNIKEINENDDENSTEEEDKQDDYFVPVIHQSDCKDECASRKSVEIEYKYCREICGLNDIEDLKKMEKGTVSSEVVEKDDNNTDNYTEEDCDDIDNAFEEDVCWKTKAIKEKNDKYCDEIYSEELSKVCHNRVLEEIIN